MEKRFNQSLKKNFNIRNKIAPLQKAQEAEFNIEIPLEYF
jgi:hypothetical protein